LHHAVRVTAGIGINFTWIDALCIMQDDGLDKDREIAKMSDYFIRGRITISAACAFSVTEGFLGTHLDFTHDPMNLACATPNGSGSILLYDTFRHTDDGSLPISQRGWT
jgi:hypothetical protein